MERRQGVALLRVEAGGPEAAAAAAEPPVRERLGEGGERPGGLVGVGALERRAHRGGRRFEVGEDPAVERGALRRRAGLVDLRVEVVDRRVDREEGVDIPDLQRELPGGGAHIVERVAASGPGRPGGEEEPAEGVRAGLGEGLLRRGVVAERLGFLAALRVGHMAEHQAGTEGVRPLRGGDRKARAGVLVEEERGDHEERVEPAPRLVHRFGDVVGGKGGEEPLPVPVREAPLGEGHGAGVEPAVNDLRDAAVHARLAGPRPGDLVHPGLVDHQVVVEVRAALLRFPEGGEGLRVPLLDLRHRGRAVEAAGLVVDPEVERGAPEPLPGERPVHIVPEEVAESPVADVLRHPFDGAAVRQGFPLLRGGADEPGRAGVLDEGVLPGAPAEGVLVADRLLVDQEAGLPEAAEDLAVGVLDPLALEPGDVRGEPAVGADRVQQGDLFRVLVPGDGGAVEVVVHLAEGGGFVDQAGALVEFHEVGGQDAPEGGDRTAAGEASFEVVEAVPVVGERRAVAAADERFAVEAAEGGEGAAEFGGQGLAEGGGDDEPSGGAVRRGGFVFDFLVLHAGAGGGVEVRGQRPGGRRPDGEGGAGVVFQRQRDGDRRILDLAVAEADLVGGERGAALRPPPDDLLAPVEQALAPEFGERPPDAFDVGPSVGHIGAVEIHPVADPGGHLLPVADVAEDGGPALLDEAADAVGLDLLPAVEAEFLLDFDLDREAVGVPAGEALHPIPAHRPVAGEGVLEDAGEDVAVVRPAVGGGRAVVPDPGFAGGAVLDALLEDAALFPEGGDLLLGGDDPGGGSGGAEAGHGGQARRGADGRGRESAGYGRGGPGGVRVEWRRVVRQRGGTGCVRRRAAGRVRGAERRREPAVRRGTVRTGGGGGCPVFGLRTGRTVGADGRGRKRGTRVRRGGERTDGGGSRRLPAGRTGRGSCGVARGREAAGRNRIRPAARRGPGARRGTKEGAGGQAGHRADRRGRRLAGVRVTDGAHGPGGRVGRKRGTGVRRSGERTDGGGSRRITGEAGGTGFVRSGAGS